MRPFEKTNVENFIDVLLSKEIVALHYCCTMPGEIDIDIYELLESGQEIDKECFDFGRIPIISDEGKKIIRQYIDGNNIMLSFPPVNH